MVSANNFLAVYLEPGADEPEIAACALTALAPGDHGDHRGQAMKYFVLGALASGFPPTARR